MMQSKYAVFFRKPVWLVLLFFMGSLSGAVAHAQSLPYKPEPSFKAGEVLHYKLKYGFISAAEAVMTVKDSELQFSTPHAYHLSAQGKTTNAFSLLFPVDNRYNSYIEDRK